MTLLEQFRLSPRWLVLLVAFAALGVTTIALLPHDDSKNGDFDCLVCKAGQKPITELSANLDPEPPLTLASRAPLYVAPTTPSLVFESSSPRAPPL